MTLSHLVVSYVVAFILGILVGKYAEQAFGSPKKTYSVMRRTKLRKPSPSPPAPYIDFHILEKHNNDEYIAEMEQVEKEREAMRRNSIRSVK